MKKHLYLLFFSVILVSIVSPNLLAKEYEITDYNIAMTLTEEGDFLVSEEITYNFLEGSFSWASREIPEKGFDRIEFVSLEGINQSVLNYELVEGNGLQLKWDFPQTDDQATFRLKYRAVAGLNSKDGRNVIDWDPVGYDWDVPIKDLDVYLYFPTRVTDLQIKPQNSLVDYNNQEIHFYYNYIRPGSNYHLIVSFPEIIRMEEREVDYSWLIIFVGIIAGITVTIVNLLRRQKMEAVKSNTGIDQLSLVEMSALYYQQGSQNKRGISAAVFSLARAGKIKLISELNKSVFKTKKTEVRVEILEKDKLSRVEEEIIKGLEKHQTLKKFSADYKMFKEISLTALESLQEKGLVLAELLQRRKQIYLSSIFIAIPGIAALIFGLVINSFLIIGIGIGGVILTFGRLLEGAVTPILSGEGFYLKRGLEKLLDTKKDKIDQVVKAQKADLALECFFDELEYIIVHKQFTGYTFNKYRKLFKKAGEFTPPYWLEFDLSNFDKTLETLDLVEVIDYFLISTAVIAANTGAMAATGAGAAGSGAGGGGGSAG